MEDTGSALDRRAVLKGAATVAAAGAAVAGIAACGSSSGSGTTTTSSQNTSGTAGSALGPVTDVPVGGGKIFADQKVVVTQPTAGSYQGFSSTCTHQGCQVTQVQNSVIVCPCHGSQFSIEDGSVKAGPASTALPAVAVTAKAGQLTLGA